MKRIVIAALATALAASGGPVLLAAPSTAAPAAPQSISYQSNEGKYVPTTPARVFDSRTTLKRQVKAGESVTVPVLGRGGVPAEKVSAVVVNLTAAKAASAGYLTAYPSTGSSGGTSTVLFAAGESRASLVTVPVGTDGAIKVLNGGGGATGPVDAIVDVQGYYVGDPDDDPATDVGATFDFDEPYRLLDTRKAGGAVKPNGRLDVSISPEGGEGAGASALAVNLTAVSPTAPGYLTAWNGAGAPPATSNVNFAKGETTPNAAIVPATFDDETGETSFSILNGGRSSTQVVVDVVGAYYESEYGLRFVPLSVPQRIVDSRTSKGTTKLGPNTSRTVQSPASVLSDPSQSDGTSTFALVGSLTAVKPTAATYLTTYPTGEDRPEASFLNPAKNQTVANQALFALDGDDQFDLYNYLGASDVLVDVAGRFEDTTIVFDSRRARAEAAQERAQVARTHFVVTRVTRR